MDKEDIDIDIDMCVCIYIYTHTIEYYSAMRKKKILIFTTTWLNLEDNTLSVISQR